MSGEQKYKVGPTEIPKPQFELTYFKYRSNPRRADQAIAVISQTSKSDTRMFLLRFWQAFGPTAQRVGTYEISPWTGTDENDNYTWGNVIFRYNLPLGITAPKIVSTSDDITPEMAANLWRMVSQEEEKRYNKGERTIITFMHPQNSQADIDQLPNIR